MSCDGGSFVFYQKRNVHDFIRRNFPLPHRVVSRKFTASEYSKISIQRRRWAEISFFALNLLLHSLIDHNRSLQILEEKLYCEMC